MMDSLGFCLFGNVYFFFISEGQLCQVLFLIHGFLDSMIRYEIKGRLLLGRKAMTNLDSVLKSRDITLRTKVCSIKVMVFPVVMYGGESWTLKKAEHQRSDGKYPKSDSLIL